MSDAIDRLRAEASMAARPGQMDRLTAIADELADIPYEGDDRVIEEILGRLAVHELRLRALEAS